MKNRALSFESLVDDVLAASDVKAFADAHQHIAMETIFAVAGRVKQSDPVRAALLIAAVGEQERVISGSRKLEDDSFAPVHPRFGQTTRAQFDFRKGFVLGFESGKKAV